MELLDAGACIFPEMFDGFITAITL